MEYLAKPVGAGDPITDKQEENGRMDYLQPSSDRNDFESFSFVC